MKFVPVTHLSKIQIFESYKGQALKLSLQHPSLAENWNGHGKNNSIAKL